MTTTPAMTDQDRERALFEQEANAARFFPAELSFAMTKSPSGRDEYANSHLQSRWEGWQAARALPQQVVAAGSIDTPEFRKLVRAVWARSSMASTSRSDEEKALIAYIDARQPASVKPEGRAADRPIPTSEQNARYAIETAIGFGREGSNKPPTEHHWLMPYWKIGQYLGPAADSWEVLEVPVRAADVATDTSGATTTTSRAALEVATGGAVNFCARCGKRNYPGSIHTCTPPANTSANPGAAQQQAATVPDEDGERWRAAIRLLSSSRLDYYFLEGRTEAEIDAYIDEARAAATTDGREG